MTDLSHSRQHLLADGMLQVHLGRITVFTLLREARRNALNAQIFAGLDEALTLCEHDTDVRVIIIQGSEQTFAAGTDLHELRTVALSNEGTALSRRGQTLFSRMASSRLPLLAAIQGIALGGGCELALACDIRVAAHSARLGMPEVGLGLLPGYGGTQRLPRLVGRGAALRLILSGVPITAEEAHRIGLVEEVVSNEMFAQRVTAIAESIAVHPAWAVATAKAAVTRGLDGSFEDGLLEESRLFGEATKRQEVHAALDAFFARKSKG